MNKLLFLFLCVILLSSCIPNKKLVYFQGEPKEKSEVYKINKTPYRLQVDDILIININSNNDELVSLFKNSSNNNAGNNEQAGNSSFFTGYSIDEHGMIRLPYIGKLNVLGYTSQEVREKIEKELKKYVKYSNGIFVSVKLQGIKYTIIGEIGSPGSKIILQNQLNIIEAISNSGDVLETGDRTNIEVIRNESGQIKKYFVDLTQIDVFNSEVFQLLPNDIINVRPLKRKSWGIGTTGLDAFQTTSAIFSVIATTILLINTL